MSNILSQERTLRLLQLFLIAGLLTSLVNCGREAEERGKPKLDAGKKIDLLGLLEEGDLSKVKEALISQKVSPPRFAIVKRLVPCADNTFSHFMKLLEAERKKAQKQKFSNREYANNLLALYEYFNGLDSYSALILCDVIKRLQLEWAQQRVAAKRTKAELEEISSVMERMVLKPNRLKVLFGSGAKPEWDAEDLADLKEASERVCISHGYEGFFQALAEKSGPVGFFPLPTSEFREKYEPVSLLLRMLNTEAIRIINLAGTVAFLKRGGDVNRVTYDRDDPYQEDKYFDSIMPPEECAKYRLGFWEKEGFTPGALLFFLKGVVIRDPDDLQELKKSGWTDFQTPWMFPVFR
jgi:hypothetical protein